MDLLITNIIQDTAPSQWARMHNFDKETKHPSATSSYIVCNSYIINSSFVHREMVIHMPAQSSAEVSPVMQWISLPSSPVPPTTASQHLVQANQSHWDILQDPPDPLLQVPFHVDLYLQLGPMTYTLR